MERHMGHGSDQGVWQGGYPVMLNISHRQAVVIGGGAVASRKIATLLRAGCHVRVISPRLAPGIDAGRIEWIARRYESHDLDGASIVIACTDDRSLNDRIANEADDAQLVNDVSNPAKSDFMNVAVIARQDVLIGVSTYGRSPRRARMIREHILQWLHTQPWWGSAH